MLDNGVYATVSEIGNAENISKSYVSRILRLALLERAAGTMTHDYVRHGTTTLFAALTVLDGTVIGRCMARHRRQEHTTPIPSSLS